MKLRNVKDIWHNFASKCQDMLNGFRGKPQKEQNNNEGIALLKSCIQLIDREKEKNETVIQRLDSYKADFRRVLDSKWTTYSGDFDVGEIDYKKNLYNEVFLNILDKNKPNLFAKREKFVGEELLLALCMLARLSAYEADIIAVREDVRARLTALSELSDEKVFLRPSKRKSLNEAINGLESSYLLLTNHLFTINSRLVRIHQDYIYLSQDEESKKAQTELIEVKRRELESMVEVIGSKRLAFYKSIDQSLVAIAKMEQELDEYVYENKERLNGIIRALRRIRLKDCLENDEEIRTDLKRCELKLKIYSIYGRNLVTIEALQELYGKKFEFLLHDALGNKYYEATEDMTFIEIECYQKCILDRFESIVRRNIFFIERFYASNDNATALMKEIFGLNRNDEPEEIAYSILENRTLLALLGAFRGRFELDKFFNEFMVPIKNYKEEIDFHLDFLDWEEYVPIGSIYMMKLWSEIEKAGPNVFRKDDEEHYDEEHYINEILNERNSDDKLYDFFKLCTYHRVSRHPSCFPKGVKKINTPVRGFRIDRTISYLMLSRNLLLIFRDLWTNHPVCLPETLEEIDGEVFAKKEELDVILNNGLIRISNGVFSGSKILKLELPSTIESATIDCFYDTKIEFLVIKLPNGEREPLFVLVHALCDVKRVSDLSGYTFKLVPKFKNLEVLFKNSIVHFDAAELMFEFVSYGNCASHPIDITSEDEERLVSIVYDKIQDKVKLQQDKILKMD